MTVFVIIDGKLVDKDLLRRKEDRSSFPTPMLSKMEPFESPVTGKEISSWAERDKDMRAVDAVDLRDYPKDHIFSRGRSVQLKEPEL